jgi:hypothetical protein
MNKVILLLILSMFVLAACGNATLPCGEFTFNGTPHSNRGIDLDLSFDFDPPTCSAPACTCDTIAYVQIVRIYDFDTGNYLAPNTDQKNRIVTGRSEATLNGWAVDRLSNRIWGYYGRNNDGSFASTLTTGSNTTDAVLEDYPSGWPDSSWFDAVSVPVCIDTGASCSNELAGYYYWLFFVGTGGTVSGPVHKNAVDWNQDAFDEAVTEWNNDASSLSKNSFPAFTRMP